LEEEWAGERSPARKVEAKASEAWAEKEDYCRKKRSRYYNPGSSEKSSDMSEEGGAGGLVEKEQSEMGYERRRVDGKGGNGDCRKFLSEKAKLLGRRKTKYTGQIENHQQPTLLIKSSRGATLGGGKRPLPP